MREFFDVFVPEVFERSAADMVIATASRQWREERSVEMSGAERRRFLKQAKDLVRPGRPVEDLHAELVKVQQRREAWRTHDPDGGWPRLPQGLDTMQATAIQARDAVEDLEPILGAGSGAPELMDLPLEDLLARVRALADKLRLFRIYQPFLRLYGTRMGSDLNKTIQQFLHTEII